MSNQMMQFDGPEGQEQQEQTYVPDPDPRYMNRDPREQGGQEQQGLPLYGAYRAQDGQTYYGEKLRPRPQKKRVQWWVPLLVTLLVLMLPMMGYFFSSHSPEQSFPMQQFSGHMKDGRMSLSQNYLFSVSNAQGRTLVIHDNNGAVQIHSGGDNSTLAIQTHSSRFGDGDNRGAVTVDNVKDPNATSPVTITAQSSFGPFSGVDLDVTVPQGMNVQVTDASGQVELSNFSGNVNVDANSGSVSLSNVTGEVKLAAQSGSISVENSQLSGNSTLTSDSGSISFDGSIAQSGSYSFTTNSGSVDITLPANTSFHLQASSQSGSVNNDFSTNDVGSQPRPVLTAQSDSGSVNIHRR